MNISDWNINKDFCAEYGVSFRANHDLPLGSHPPQSQKTLRGSLQHFLLDHVKEGYIVLWTWKAGSRVIYPR